MIGETSAGAPPFSEFRGSAFDLAALTGRWVPRSCDFGKGGYDAADTVSL